MAVLIDSSVFIALERRGAEPDEVLTLVPDEPVALAAVSASELLFGVERADTPQRRARRERFVEAMLALIPVLPFGTAEARLHARVWAGLVASGQVIGAHDLLIAATALRMAMTCSQTTCASSAAFPAWPCAGRRGPVDRA
jgi:tRNA(fMet)-specific endonuclease VapC